MKKTAPWVALAAGAMIALLARSVWLRIGPEVGLPLDDAWIHIRFAVNLAGGHGFSFNPQEASAGATSPLWVLLLAALHGLPGGVAAHSAALSAVFFIIACLLVAALTGLLARRADPEVDSRLVQIAMLAAGVGTALTGRFAWSALSGMEVSLAAALELGVLCLAVRDRGRWRAAGPGVAVLAGLAVLVRPEALLLLVLILLAGAWEARRMGTWGRHGLVMAAGLAPVLPWAVYCLVLTGRPLPATFGPNGGSMGWPDLHYLGACVRQLALDNPVGTLLAMGGVVFLASAVLRLREVRLLLVPAMVLLFPLAAAVVAPNLRHHGRYTMPLIPMVASLAGVGLIGMVGVLRRRPHKALAMVFALALVCGPLPALSRWLTGYGWEVENIQHQHVRVARWLAASGDEDCHVATHDIGAIGVLSGCRVTDLIGLVTPEMARLYVQFPDPGQRDPAMGHLLEAWSVTHVAIYPGWFPSLAAHPHLQPVFSARVKVLASAGAPRMIIYRTPETSPW